MKKLKVKNFYNLKKQQATVIFVRYFHSCIFPSPLINNGRKWLHSITERNGNTALTKDWVVAGHSSIRHRQEMKLMREPSSRPCTTTLVPVQSMKTSVDFRLNVWNRSAMCLTSCSMSLKLFCGKQSQRMTSINKSIKMNLYSASYKQWTEALNNKTIKYVAVNYKN